MGHDDDLKEALIYLQRRGWAGGKQPVENPDGSKTVTCQMKDLNGRVIWDSNDTWSGTDRILGDVIVRHWGQIDWHLHYSGGLKRTAITTDGKRYVFLDGDKTFPVIEIFKFMQKAFLAGGQPIRGPPEFRAGNLLYRNFLQGDINEPKGYDVVFYLEEQPNTSTDLKKASPPIELHRIEYSGGRPI